MISQNINLTIDIGNSYIKLDLFEEMQWLKHWRFDTMSETQLKPIFKSYGIRHCIISSVRSYDNSLHDLLKSYCNDVIWLSHTTLLPIKIAYQTPECLGRDRIAALVGAWSIKPQSNCLVIDIGTCITYDFLSESGVFEGGNIAPGWRMRLKAMHQFTHTLPDVEPQVPETDWGLTTIQAMENGAYYGIVSEIGYVIDKLKLKHTDLQLFLTGGDAAHFEKQIKNCIFAIPNLVPIGLNQILHYNESK